MHIGQVDYAYYNNDSNTINFCRKMHYAFKRSLILTRYSVRVSRSYFTVYFIPFALIFFSICVLPANSTCLRDRSLVDRDKDKDFMDDSECSFK